MATSWMSGLRSFRYRPVPIRLPLVPWPGAEVGDLRAVPPDLRAGALVVGAGVGVVAVLVEEAPLGMLDGEQLGPPHGPIRTLGPRREDDLGAEQLEHLPPFDRDVVGEQD